jgi:hypothetical protein
MVYSLSEDEIMDRCGLDTLTFLRFLRLGQKVALLSILLSAVLFPLYATTATLPTTVRSPMDPLERITMSNVPAHDPRLWASTIAAYLVTLFALYLLFREYEEYVCRRHEILSSPIAPQYTILIDDLPSRLRTKQTLENYLKKLFPNTIRSIYVAVESSRLENLVERRNQIRNALEHALAVNEKKKKGKEDEQQPQGSNHRDQEESRRYESWWRRLKSCGRQQRDDNSIQFYQSKLDEMNELVLQEIESIELSQSELTQQFEEREKTMTTTTTTGSMQRNAYRRMRTSFQRQRKSEFEDDEEVQETISMPMRNPLDVMRRAAFVSFNSLASSQIAQQVLQSNDPIRMTVHAAPDVEDIKWENIGLDFKTRALWRLISIILTILIVFFWTIPSAFVASLSTIDSLREAIPFLKDAFDQYPFLENIFKQIAPLCLALLSTIVAPLIFSFLSTREGHASITQVKASLFNKLAYFQLIQVFFVPVIVGTILDSLKEILDQPKKLIHLLGRSMPQQSTFFISYVIVLTGLKLTMELLRIVPLFMSCLFYLFAPHLTRREKKNKWFGLCYFSTTDPFDPTNILADCLLVFVVTLTFSSIAPFVCYFTCFFFFLAEIFYRRQVLFIYKSTSFAMGAFWPRLYKFCIGALVLAQMTLLGLLSLKNAPGEFICVLILLCIVLFFHHSVEKLFPRLGKYLPLTECERLDTLRDGQNYSYHFLDNVYVQPAMNERHPIRAEYRMIRDDD